ncbi:MAG: N-acetyltransferase, partial [Bacteroidales bacterium]|nr:N-acetyltransferase [Bacteroidales bacterium]
MSVTIKKVETKADLKAFVKFPLELYKGCPYYVPNIYLDEMSTLDPAKNPMSKYSKSAKFLALKDGKIVGRVAAIINEIANRDWNHQEVRFGWIDFIDDKEVSKALIEAVIAFGKEYGMTQISGPLGFTDFDNEGCVVEGFDDISSFFLKYNYSYYGAHFEALGMGKVNDWLEYRIFVPEQLPEKVTRAAGLVATRYQLHVRKITKKEVKDEQYGQKIFDLVNRTYNALFDFTVLPPEVIDHYVNTFLGLLDLNYVTLVENNEGKLVGLAICMPSLAHAVKKGNG